MSTNTQTPPADPLALVVFGRDDAGKAHGSAFTASDAELATKAADLMGMRALPIRTEVECTLAAKLPRGRVFASGKAFVPFIKAALLTELQTAALNSGLPALKVVGGVDSAEPAKLVAAASAKQTTAGPKKDDGAPQVKQPTGWGDIEVGAIVLALYKPETAEWYECVVLAAEGEDSFVLRYCDWPKLPPFTRRRAEIALMHPAHAIDLPLEPELSLTAS